MDRQFNRASLILVGSMVRVKLGFSAAKGCTARLSSDLYAGADAGVAARGQAGGSRHEPARRRTRVSSDDDGGGYQLRRWSTIKYVAPLVFEASTTA